MDKPNTALLPNGLQDLLPPEAEKEAQAIHSLMSGFKRFGYKRVKPPLVEFEESLLAPGPGKALTRQTFRLMDPVSQRMMGVRADTTAQISRISVSRLESEIRPLRLAYAADVLRVNGSALRPERQFCQVGCELIGDESIRSDSEIALLALKGLTDLGVSDITIDLTVPSLVEHVFDAHEVSSEEKEDLKGALERRDYDAIDPLTSEINQTLAKLMACIGPADAVLPELLDVVLPEKAAESTLVLKSVYDDLKDAIKAFKLSDVSIAVDAVEHKGFEYHKGVSFTLFAKGVRGELGSGGRYQSNGETATGFTLYMDTVLRAMPDRKDEDIRTVSSSESWEEIFKLQNQDQNIIRKG